MIDPGHRHPHRRPDRRPFGHLHRIRGQHEPRLGIVEHDAIAAELIEQAHDRNRAEQIGHDRAVFDPHRANRRRTIIDTRLRTRDQLHVQRAAMRG